MTNHPTILVVSADRIVQFFISELGDMGYTVLGATNVSEGSSICKRTLPDLVLIFDYFIDGATDPLSVCYQLRNVIDKDCSFILIASEFYRDQASKHGINWFHIVGGMSDAIEYIRNQCLHF